MTRYKRNMSNSERRAYRRRKKLIRKIQVYSEITVITLALIVGGGLIISHFKSNDDTSKLKEELLTAIKNETVDIRLMYQFYSSIK